ncbi:MAG TPA: hypothetical protein VK171_04450 [Fimbriimonas sp.]|nr:hypothetical protein [Fimbriimonas sp.]
MDTEQIDFIPKARDIFIRSRTNALAHKIGAEKYEFLGGIFFVIETLLVVLPIFALILSLTILNNQTAPASMQISVPGYLSYGGLTLLAIFMNGAALVLSMIKNKLRWDEKALSHRNLETLYLNISLKIRRVEEQSLSDQEISHLRRHLEEMFEQCKFAGHEPNDHIYSKAQAQFKRLNGMPFGLGSRTSNRDAPPD